MPIKTAVLRPGLLVALSTRLKGNVNYERRDTDPEHIDPSGAKVASWETTREISDPVEWERAVKARSAARSAVVAACAQSSFALLCASANESRLESAIAEARDIAQAFNDSAKQTRLEVYILVGKVAQDDVEAAKAISAEVRELLEAMKSGIAAADPQAIRDAANRAKQLGEVLSPDVAGKVSAAIVEARRAARLIVARVEKAGDKAADVLKECTVRAIETARFAFLDTDETAPMKEATAAPAREVEILEDGPFGRSSTSTTTTEGGESAPAAQSALPFQLEV